MSRDPSQSQSSLQIARRLLARGAAPGSGNGRRVDGAELQQACLRIAENLRDALGADGSDALLSRAFARTEAQHPALQSIRRLNGGGIQVDGVTAGLEAHGAAAVASAIEAFLAAVVDILGRLIGEDMAIRLVDPGAIQSRSSDGGRRA